MKILKKKFSLNSYVKKTSSYCGPEEQIQLKSLLPVNASTQVKHSWPLFFQKILKDFSLYCNVEIRPFHFDSALPPEDHVKIPHK